LKLKVENDKETKTYATPTYTEYANELQAYPASNYRRNSISEAELSGISYEAYKKRAPRKSTCWSCPLACTLDVKSKNRGLVRGPEYETLWALGANCDNFDMDVVIECNYLCNSYGLDTINTGSVLAWYKECIDTGLTKDTWSSERMVELIHNIANRTGIGDALAEGAVKAAKKLGFGENLIAHSKGLELPAWDPRTAIGMALAYATAPTGGDHCKAWTVESNTSDPKKQFQTKGKAEDVIEKQNESALLDSTGTCMFAAIFMYENETWSEILAAYLGLSISPEKLEKIGDIIFQLEHQINKKLGHDISENVLPERIIGYEIEVGGKKVKLTQEMFDEMLQQYYKLRKWTT
jgi:aldehyde:ferredoxin oxidoreductase